MCYSKVQKDYFQSANLLNHPKEWENIGVSDTVLSWIQHGVPLPLSREPGSFELQNRNNFSDKAIAFIDKELKLLKDSGAIVECSEKPLCISPISVVPKKGQDYRLIIDLRHLNSACNPPKFVYEDINTVLEQIKPNDHIVTADIKSGFHHVPIHRDYHKYLGFAWKSKYYVWQVLPFGLNISPYFFCKVVRPVVTFLRSLGIRIVVYVDDMVVMSPEDTICEHRDIVLDLFRKQGWFINFQESSLTPRVEKPFIGYVLKTVNPDGKVRGLARIAGQCISMVKAILPAKLLLRNIYRLLQSRSLWQDTLVFDLGVINDLNWWLSALHHWNGRAVQPHTTPIQMTTDASAIGWGAAIQVLNIKAQGLWNTRLSFKPSNTREIMAVLLGLLSFLPSFQGKAVQVLTDNITTAAYINFHGGPSREITQIATAIWEVALTNDITLSAKYLAGSQNQVADALSRLTSPQVWRLNPRVFHYLDVMWGPHTVDRFASLATAQLRTYNSMFHDPYTSGVDAMAQHDWQQHNNYVCPPFRLLNQVLNILVEQRAMATVIAPQWPGQPWYQLLLRLSVCPPLQLLNSPMTFLQIGPVLPEPLKNPKWKIFAWRINGALP
jgi:hypothetical protein